jgi:hypothetical protein
MARIDREMAAAELAKAAKATETMLAPAVEVDTELAGVTVEERAVAALKKNYDSRLDFYNAMTVKETCRDSGLAVWEITREIMQALIARRQIRQVARKGLGVVETYRYLPMTVEEAA